MATYGAAFTDVAPAEPALYGVLSPAAVVVTDGDGHWTRGFEYETTDCAVEVTLADICNTSAAVTAVESAGGPLFRGYYPFAVRASFTCSTMSRTPEDIESLATRALELCLQKAVERELWTGELAKASAVDYETANPDETYPNRYLASTDSVDVTPTPGTPVKTKFGLALLEKALGDCGCGGRGTIHAPREAASALGLKGKDDLLETHLGNKVIAGVGYTGSGPDGTEPTGTRTWMYATGPVTVRLGAPVVYPEERTQAVDTTNNSTTYYVEQVAAVTWNSCCQHAVLVDLSLDYS